MFHPWVEIACSFRLFYAAGALLLTRYRNTPNDDGRGERRFDCVASATDAQIGGPRENLAGDVVSATPPDLLASTSTTTTPP
jgi:hypothetical protein